MPDLDEYLKDKLARTTLNDDQTLKQQTNILWRLLENHHKEQFHEFSNQLKAVVKEVIAKKIQIYRARQKQISEQHFENEIDRKKAFATSHTLLSIDMIHIDKEISEIFNEPAQIIQ